MSSRQNPGEYECAQYFKYQPVDPKRLLTLCASIVKKKWGDFLNSCPNCTSGRPEAEILK
jgi:hypothetical protein